jgi:hypothetical protein
VPLRSSLDNFEEYTIHHMNRETATIMWQAMAGTIVHPVVPRTTDLIRAIRRPMCAGVGQ